MSSIQRVLSIQSHVISGYCGNKSAVFPLQVDFINSVQFSNHTGYKNGWTGQVLHEDDLLQLYDGLKKNKLHTQYTHILTGYARSASFLEAMYKVIKETKALNPNTIYLCDPVLGDNGKLYVPAELVPVYRDQIVPLADVICPNQFEAETLSGMPIKDLKSAVEAMDKLHAKGPKTVVISSTDNIGPSNELVIMVSSYHKSPSNREIFQLKVPRLNVNFIGTGDLFAALFLAWFTKTNFDVKKTLENVVSTLQIVIHRTHEFAAKQPESFTNHRNFELKIIQCRNEINCPKVTIFASPVSL